MIDPVVVRFAVGGVQEVDRAFDSIIKRIEKNEAAGTRAVRDASRTRVKAAEDEATQRERAYQKLVKETERWERQHEREESQTAKRIANEERKERERSAREFEKIEQYKMRVRQRSAEMAGRYAEQEARAEITARERAARAMGAHAGRVGSSLGSMAGMAGTALSIGGGFALADIAGKQLSSEKSAALLLNSATVGGQGPAGYDTRRVLAEAGQVSKETGVDKGELIDAVRTYVARAGADKFGSAMGNMGFFAQLSKATGTDLQSITGAAGILQAQNKGLSQKDMQQMLLDLMEQGKQGAVEISDLASLSGSLGSTRGLYQGSVTDNQRKLLALAQVTRTEGSSAEEAAIAVKDLGTEAVSKAGKRDAPAWLRGAVDSKTGLIKGGPEKLIEAALMGTGGNLGQLSEVFGARGVKAFQRLAPIFNAAGGGAKGLAAVHAEMDPLLNAKGSQSQLAGQFATVMQTPAERLHAAWEKLVVTTGDRLEPMLEKLADKIPDLADKFSSLVEAGGKLAEFFLDNPFAGIGAVIAASTAKEIASAALGSTIEKALASSLGQSISSGGMKLAVAGGAVAIAAGVVNMQMQQLEHAQAQREEAGSELGHTFDVAREQIAARMKTGKLSSADIANYTKLIHVGSQGIRQQINDTPGLTEIAGQTIGGFARGDFTGQGAQEAIRKHADVVAENQKKLQALSAALNAATEAVHRFATADPARSVPIDHRTVGGS